MRGRFILPPSFFIFLLRISILLIIFATQWKTDTDQDLQRRKEAELLIKEDLPYEILIPLLMKYNIISISGAKENKNSLTIKSTYKLRWSKSKHFL